MKTMKVYPLSTVTDPPATTFVDGSRQEIDTIFRDTGQFFVDLAAMIEAEPHEVIPSHERFQLASIGIEKGKPFTPDATRQALLDDAARFGAAIARSNSFDSDDPARLVYPDRAWEWAFIGGSATWDSQGYLNADRRAAFAYIAAGMSPAMVEKHVGAGSQYLWTPRDATGAFLDGGKRYRLRIPPDIPAQNFWSVVAYDADSRSILRSDQPFPSISTYTHPRPSADQSIDILFGPDVPADADANWIQTVPGKGWFVLFRFYGPLEPFFARTWKPDMSVEDKVQRSILPIPDAQHVGRDHVRRQGSGHEVPADRAAAAAEGRAERAGRAARRRRLRRVERVRRPDPHADRRAPGEERPQVQPLSHDRAVLADAPGAADRAQPSLGQHGRHLRDRDLGARLHLGAAEEQGAARR